MPPLPRFPPGVQPPSGSSSLGVGRGGMNRGPRNFPPKPGPASGVSEKNILEDVEIEEYRPPEWRTVLNRSADLGYPDFYPSRPGHFQPEDVLTEENVKNGFTGKAPIATSAESFSMHGPIHQHLLAGGLERLIALGEEVEKKRNEAMPGFGERSFRIPVRVTYNDTKRFQFLSELSNPDIPLHRLMRNPVPHGFKGIELLDAMFSPPSSGSAGQGQNRTPSGGTRPPPGPIPVDRALWFIRVLGVNEITAHRGRAQPAPAPVQAPSPVAATPSSTTTIIASAPQLSSNDWYTLDFTNTFTSWLRIQLGQLALPKNSPKPNVQPIKAMGVLGDEKSRTRWLSKWHYSISLLRHLHSRRLLSSRILTSWLADSLGTANLAQLGFIAHLVGEFMADMSRHVTNGRHCVKACCDKIKEIRASPVSSTMTKVEAMLVTIVMTLYTTNAEVFLSPTTWKLHQNLLESLVVEYYRQQPDSDQGSATKPIEALARIKRRNEALMFKPVTTESTSSPRRLQMEEIHKLDSICADTDMSQLCKSFFHGPSAPNSSTLDMSKLEEKLFIVLNWAMGLFYLGSHRPYAVYTLIKMWMDQYDEQPSTSRRPATIDFFPLLYNWLNFSDSARKPENAPAIGITFGELTRQGLFSYGRYLQTLIARGQTARCRTNGSPPSHHLSLLRAMPIFVQAKDLLRQRQIALCGDDVELRRQNEMEEDGSLEALKEEIKEYIPEIFEMKRYGQSALYRDEVDHHLHSTTMSRYIYVSSRFWVFPAAVAGLVRQGSTPAIGSSAFARVLHFFQLSRGYATVADYIIKALAKSKDEEVLNIIIDTIKRGADFWTAMDRWSPIIDGLMIRFHKLLDRGRFHHSLADLLLELAEAGRVSKDDALEIRVARDKSEKSQTFPSVGYLNPKESMNAVRQIINEDDLSEGILLAPKLFVRHGVFATWSDIWWTTIISTARHLPVDGKGCPHLNALVSHLQQVDDFSGRCLDSVIGHWLDGLDPSSRNAIFGGREGITIATLLLRLVADRRLSAVTLLERLGYPEWKHSASICLSSHGRLTPRQLQTAETIIHICRQLLLATASTLNLPPLTLRQALIFQTTRARVFHQSHIQKLIQYLPFLVVLQETKCVPLAARERINSLLRALAMTPEFKTAAFRHLDLLKDAFLSNEWSQRSNGALEAGMVDILKLIMSDGSSSGSKTMSTLPSLDSASRFSAWRWTRIVLEMRVEFKRLAMRIQSGEDVVEAKQTLNRLVHSSLNREASADDTDLLCEAFRGIEPVVTQEILAAGLDRLGTLLAQVMEADHQHESESAGQSIDLVLRILDSTRRTSENVPLDAATVGARDRLLGLLAVGLQSVERQMSTEAEIQVPGLNPPHPGDLLKIAIKLLLFTLGLSGFDSLLLAAPKPDFSNLAVCFFRVMIAVSGTNISGHTTESLGDILIYIVDSAPPQSRSAVYTALTWESSSSASHHTFSETPSLLNALPYRSPMKRPVELKGSQTVDDGTTDSLILLDDRPWEMLEQMVPTPRVPSAQNQYLMSQPMRDTASIPMSLFTPQFKRDILSDQMEVGRVSNGVHEEGGIDFDWMDYSSERNLGNGQAGESIAVRQSATQLYDRGQRLSAPTQNDVQVVNESNKNSPLPSASAPSPLIPPQPPSVLGSRIRRMSTRSTGPGTVFFGGSNNPIQVDDDDDDESKNDGNDDDLEVTEAPPPGKRPRTAGKSTTVSGRSTTGGKAPAKKTVGGKNVARKTAGKSTRGGAAKSTRGRRRSGAE